MFFLGLAIAALLYTALFFAAPAIERYFAMVGLASYLRVLALILFAGDEFQTGAAGRLSSC